MALRLSRFTNSLRVVCQIRSMSQWGDGAGKGGGSGGAVRDAGGAFGKMEAAQEEQYFRKMQQQQLDTLKDSLQDEIVYHEKEIKEAEEAIQRRKQKIEQLKKIEKPE